MGKPIAVIRCDDGKTRKAPVSTTQFWMDKIVVWRNSLDGTIHYITPFPDMRYPLENEADIIEKWAAEEEKRPFRFFLEKTAERMPDLPTADLPPYMFRDSWRWQNGGITVYMPGAIKIKAMELNKSAKEILATNAADTDELREFDAKSLIKSITSPYELAAYDPLAKYRK